MKPLKGNGEENLDIEELGNLAKPPRRVNSENVILASPSDPSLTSRASWDPAKRLSHTALVPFTMPQCQLN